MNRKEFVDKLASDMGKSKASTLEFVEAYENAVKDVLSAGESIVLHNFMKIYIKDVAARNGVNPRTKERILIPEHKSVGVKILKGLKDCIDE